jgi:adenylate cyclase class 2
MRALPAARRSTRISGIIIVATARSSPVETEVKLAVPDAAAARRRLRAAGFRVLHRRSFESNVLFDTPDLRLRASQCLLRVRQNGHKVKLTYKGPPRAATKHKSREELEIEGGDTHTWRTILERLGFHPGFRYEKYRSEYRGTGAGVVTLDETPIGIYLELEGSPSWIDRTARHLGFTEQDYIILSYGQLYREWCEKQGRQPANMVFRGR